MTIEEFKQTKLFDRACALRSSGAGIRDLMKELDLSYNQARAVGDAVPLTDEQEADLRARPGRATRGGRIEKHCVVCGQLFRVPPSRAQRKTCGDEYCVKAIRARNIEYGRRVWDEQQKPPPPPPVVGGHHKEG